MWPRGLAPGCRRCRYGRAALSKWVSTALRTKRVAGVSHRLRQRRSSASSPRSRVHRRAVVAGACAAWAAMLASRTARCSGSGRGAKHHVTKTFKISNDPNFEAKFCDVIGLYLDPPTNALVLCCDEKSQCQALERTQFALPLAPNRPRTMTHDYTRHGTITLFAALIALTGKLITRTEVSHTHVEWLRFLKQIDRETPKDLDLHLIADNYA